MAILDGAYAPVQGYITDAAKSLQLSFIVPLIVYACVASYRAI